MSEEIKQANTVEAKPAGVQPAEVKPAEVKPAEVKPAETKPKKTQKKSDENEIFISPAPHVISPIKTQNLMQNVLLALLPVTVYSVYLYSMAGAVRIVLSIVTAVVSEILFRRILKRDVRIKDFSAVITGLLFALVIPPVLPLWMVILGSAFAVIVGKEFFGGLGSNPFNPALVGRAFLLASFTKPMSGWVGIHSTGMNIVPWTKSAEAVVDSIGSATPLFYANPNTEGVMATLDIAKSLGFDSSFELYTHLFLGQRGGSIGESSIALILIGFLYLLVKRVIDWRTPVAMITTTVLLTTLAGVDPLISLMSGGLVFGAVFMATDYVTSPVTPMGKIFFGIGCGLITAIIRLYSALPEGVMFSILVMNTVVPFLDRIIPRKYGFVKKKKPPKEKAK